MKKAKKWIIFLCAVLAVLVTIVIFCCTLFSVKDVRVDFRTSTVNTYTETEIIEKSKIPYRKCVFFLKKKAYKENIEKEFPYLEVINIETKIPSHIVIHVAEREEFYAIVHSGKTYICDDDLKVLRIENSTEYNSLTNNAIKVDGKSLHIINEEIIVGDFLEVKEESLLDLYNVFLKNNRGRSEMLSFVKEIKFFQSKEQVTENKELSIEITTHYGRKICIYNVDYGFEYKLQKVFSLMSNIMEIRKFKYDNVLFDRDKTENDNDKMTEILTGAELHVYNYISKTEFSEKDNYYILKYNNIDLKTV